MKLIACLFGELSLNAVYEGLNLYLSGLIGLFPDVWKGLSRQHLPLNDRSVCHFHIFEPEEQRVCHLPCRCIHENGKELLLFLVSGDDQFEVESAQSFIENSSLAVPNRAGFKGEVAGNSRPEGPL